jgi:hypothetical protein
LNAGGGTASRGGDGWITSNKVSIFPNPAAGVLNVAVDDLQTNATLQVHDVMGKLVMQQQTNKNVTALNVSKMPSGIYMRTIKVAEATSSIKCVKE